MDRMTYSDLELALNRMSYAVRRLTKRLQEILSCCSVGQQTITFDVDLCLTSRLDQKCSTLQDASIRQIRSGKAWKSNEIWRVECWQSEISPGEGRSEQQL